MRLRSQFAVLVGLAVVVGAVSLAALVWSARETRQLAQQQQHAVSMAREVTGLLVLTQDYLLHAEPRDEQQWWVRHRVLSQAVAAQQAGGAAGQGPLIGARIEALSELFNELQRLPARDTPLALRRRELLVDRLLTEAQAVAEQGYERERQLTQRRNESEFRLMTLAVALPAALALLFALAGWLLARRVLRPLARLRSAMDAAASGDLSVRDRSGARDELGALSRQFDRMTAQLQERSDALRASEAMLRLVTNNLPAMIGYWDSELRNRFANADYRRWFGKEPQEIHARRIDELLGPELYEQNRPCIEGALAGQRQDFDRSIRGPDGIVRHSQASYIPDVHAGRVEGFFVLVTDVSERVRSAQALAQALGEKETLLKEVYHRVKNNLQVVQSLLKLQSRAVHEHAARVALEEMAQRVRAMALVHEQLYSADSPDAVALKRYVESLARQLALSCERAPGDTRLDVDAASVEIGIDVAIPLGLLLTELISNSFKHAFADGRPGRIQVEVGPREDGTLRVRVADDGRGLPPGFELAAVRSLGLQLAASLAHQLGGELCFESSGGTTAWLAVPRDRPKDTS
jgi:PAS domain S-box-containing protein